LDGKIDGSGGKQVNLPLHRATAQNGHQRRSAIDAAGCRKKLPIEPQTAVLGRLDLDRRELFNASINFQVMDKPTEKDKTMSRSGKYREIGLQVDVPTEDELLRIIRLFLRSISDHNYELDLLAGEDDEFKAAVAKFADQLANKFPAPKITKDGWSEEDIQREEEYSQRVDIKHYISCALETAVAGKYNEGMNRQEIIAYFVERGLSPGIVNNYMRGIVPEEESLAAAIFEIVGLIIGVVIFIMLRKN
jgi:hypothetical protein